MNIEDILKKLAKTRKIFHSEADFQHALAWQIHEDYPDAQVRLELPTKIDDNSIRVDCKVKYRNISTFIELKYKTAALKTTNEGEDFELKQQAAQDLARYDFIKDIQRIESIIGANKSSQGWAIFLTNDHGFWNESRKKHPIDENFRLHEGRKLIGTLGWHEHASAGTTESREAALTLMRQYDLQWQQYSEVTGQKNGEFKYLLVKVGL